MVSDLVEGTLLACGADVINVGLCTTPGTEMAVITKRADGGIIITASHNPRQWNALKLLNSDGEIPLRRRGQARAGDGRGGGLRVPRRGRHRACAFARIVQPDAYRTGAGASARRRRGGPQTPLRGGRGRCEFRGRYRDAGASAAAGMRGRGAELRPDGRIRPQPRTAARKT